MTGLEGRTPIDGTSFPVPFDLMRAQVDSEIAAAINANGITIAEYLGNFRNWLRPTVHDDEYGAHYREPLMSRETFKTRHDLIDLGETRESHSDRWLSDSDKDFLRDIDLAMARVGVDAEVVELMGKVASSQGYYKTHYRDRLAEYILPVYVCLRSLGYNHNELSS